MFDSLERTEDAITGLYTKIIRRYGIVCTVWSLIKRHSTQAFEYYLLPPPHIPPLTTLPQPLPAYKTTLDLL